MMFLRFVLNQKLLDFYFRILKLGNLHLDTSKFNLQKNDKK